VNNITVSSPVSLSYNSFQHANLAYYRSLEIPTALIGPDTSSPSLQQVGCTFACLVWQASIAFILLSFYLFVVDYQDAHLISSLATQFNNKELSDVCLVADKEQFYCHTLVIFTRSNHLKKLRDEQLKKQQLSSSDKKETSSSRLVVDVDAQLLLGYLQFLYTDKVSLPFLSELPANGIVFRFPPNSKR